MADTPRSYPDLALLALRVWMMAMLIVFHGWGKLTGLAGHLFGGEEWGFVKFVGEGLGFPLPLLFAAGAAIGESVAALLVAAGLLTRYAAALVAATMGVAVWRHVTTDMRFELASLYLLVAVLFLFVHPGKYSLDAWLRSRQ